jgi:hypothetical protein
MACGFGFDESEGSKLRLSRAKQGGTRAGTTKTLTARFRIEGKHEKGTRLIDKRVNWVAGAVTSKRSTRVEEGSERMRQDKARRVESSSLDIRNKEIYWMPF